MGFAETMRILSGINCGLSSANTYMGMRMNGVNPNFATASLFGNLANGFARNEIAYGMQKMGNPYGNLINSAVGYGNPVSNTIGTLGIMSACSPWMFFNSGCYMNPCGFNYYPGFNFFW